MIEPDQGDRVSAGGKNNELVEANVRNDSKTCKRKLKDLLKTRCISYSLVLLIIADSLISVAILMIQIEYFEDQQSRANNSTGYESATSTGYESATSTGYTSKQTVEILQIVSLTILSLSMVETSLTLYCMIGTSRKSRICFQLFDFCVVLTLLVVDIVVIVISSNHENPLLSHGLGLLVLLRLVRILKLLKSTGDKVRVNEQRMELEKANRIMNITEQSLKETEGQLKETKNKLKETERMIEDLQHELRKHSSDRITPLNLPPLTLRTPLKPISTLSSHPEVNNKPELPGPFQPNIGAELTKPS